MTVGFEKVNQAAQQFVAEACTLHPVERAILFGSYAKGTPHPWSDIDIALFFHDLGDDNLEDVAVDLIGRGENLIPLSWDTYIEPHVFVTEVLEEHDPFIEEILKTGRDIPLPTPSNSASFT